MGAAVLGAHAFSVQDVEYRHLEGDRGLLATVYRPEGAGPFPTILAVHGGAWVHHDRAYENDLHEALASRGILTVTIDFRTPPEASYPASVQDINYAIRWLKIHALDFGGVTKIGAIGVSSGAHLSILSGMRPRDERYAALPLDGHSDVDATLSYVVACWPPVDPLYRYQFVKKAGNQKIVKDSEDYWVTEEAMSEGSPPSILERGEPAELPPVLIIQRAHDDNHPIEMQQRLVAEYRKRGSEIEMPIYDDLPWFPGWRFSVDPAAPDTGRVMDAITAFVSRHG